MLAVPVQNDLGKDSHAVSDSPLLEIAKAIKFPVPLLSASDSSVTAFTVVRKSFDARKLVSLQPRAYEFIDDLEPQVGFIDHLSKERVSGDLFSVIDICKRAEDRMLLEGGGCDGDSGSVGSERHGRVMKRKPKIAVVGSGPSGLFAALVLAELGADVTLIERDQPVEQRGRDIGALMVRRILELESNFCFGKVSIRFGTRVDDLIIENAQMLHSHNIDLVPEDFAYSGLATDVHRGRGKVPVADYKVASYDFDALNFHGPLAGVEFQREFERRAALMGGGDFVLPGFILKLFKMGLRTSSPVQISRSRDTYESTSVEGLYPVGEGAGYAGGIVSSAVDGMNSGFAVAKKFGLYIDGIESFLGKAQSAGLV
ncbi:hypothetical protein Tsubulata_008224, partial [Turnera subulata]